jgi:5'-nucleotidase
MRILLSNDDGILAPGILAMYNALAADAEVHVVAPASVQSASAHAITIRHPLICQRVHVGGRFYGTSVEGSPADCVKLAIRSLLPDRPHLVVSGINAGANVGIHVLYSGTVAAAAEGALLGCPAVAVSLEFADEMDFERAGRIARSVIDRIVELGLCAGQLYNVNIPALKPGWPRGIRVAPQSTLGLVEQFERRSDPNKRDYYWLSGTFGDMADEQGTDLYYLREGYVVVTPLHFDLTHVSRLSVMSEWTWPQIGGM